MDASLTKVLYIFRIAYVWDNIIVTQFIYEFIVYFIYESIYEFIYEFIVYLS